MSVTSVDQLDLHQSLLHLEQGGGGENCIQGAMHRTPNSSTALWIFRKALWTPASVLFSAVISVFPEKSTWVVNDSAFAPCDSLWELIQKHGEQHIGTDKRPAAADLEHSREIQKSPGRWI